MSKNNETTEGSDTVGLIGREVVESYSQSAFESVERFQSLQAGQYWRAQTDIVEEGIDAGMVLLIQSIRWVDNVQHTVILRPHPSKIGKKVYLHLPREDGTMRKTFFEYDEHRFLLCDFLSRFEFEPDYQRIRSDEVRGVQERINALQAELLETQSKPALLAGIVEAALREKEPTVDSEGGADEVQARGKVTPAASLPAVRGSDVVSLTTGTLSDAIGARITSEGVAAMKAAANREHQIATIKANWIQGKTTAIAEAITAMTPYYQEQAAAALAHTEDVRSYVAKLMQGIESLDLYVGKDVEVQTVREGVHAPRDVPLTFVQRKLLMDEELAVWTDIDEWFDFEKEDLFFDALRTHDGLIAQIFPTERCVLVMATTRRHIDYGDSWANTARNDENRKVFLLVRDGMTIHRVFSPVESHLHSDRLFPTQDDQERVFRGFDGSQIKFEDVAYTDKLAEHDRFALHYKRFLLLVCGLDHRLKLFGDFYDGPQSLDFVSMGFQDRNCRFLHDDDESRMLPGQERASVDEWVEEKNAYLRSGSRVLCNWQEVMNPATAPGACRSNNDHSSYGRGFDRRYEPKDRVSVAIAYKEGESFCVDVAVSGYSYSTHADRDFNCKVSLSRLKGCIWDYTDLPFLCLDSVEPADLEWYIRHRGSRKNHLAYIRFFKRALKHVERERSEEQATRDRLAQAMADGNIADASERDSIISQAVVAWRAANRGQGLPVFDGSGGAAWKSLLNQMYMLAGEGKQRVAEIEAFAQALGLLPLRLVLSGGAKLVLYAEPKMDERDDRLEPHAWVQRITVERGKTKHVEKARRWMVLPKQAASETTLHQWIGAEEWAGRVSAFQSYEHKVEMMARADGFVELLKPFTARMSELEHEGQFGDWKAVRDLIMKRSKYVRNPEMAIPFGLVHFRKSNRVQFLCVGSHRPHTLLAQLAPSVQAGEAVRSAYIKPFQKKDSAGRDFDAGVASSSHDWVLLGAPLTLAEERNGVFAHRAVGVEIESLSKRGHSPLLSEWFDNWMAENKKNVSVWLANGAVGADGNLALDSILGIKLPADYEVVRVREIKLVAKSGELPTYHRWFDLCTGEDGSGGASFWSSGSDKEIKRLVGGVVGGKTGIGYSSSERVFVSRASARESITECVESSFGEDCRAVAAAELADAPRPPEGVERWYVVEVS